MCLKNMMNNLYSEATILNRKNILYLLVKNEKAKLLDLGCNTGKFSLKLAKRIGTDKIYGIEIVEGKIKAAKKRGIKVIKSDLNKKFPIEDNFFDVVHTNQVIEHLTDVDNFVGEIFRVLKPGGIAIISTENGSSWCNIFAAIMGWQIFSLTNVSSKKAGIGNPLALLRNEKIEFSSWTHKTIFNFRGLIELFQVFNFTVENIRGAGYFPLPNFFGNIDKRHCHFITLKVRKKL